MVFLCFLWSQTFFMAPAGIGVLYGKSNCWKKRCHLTGWRQIFIGTTASRYYAVELGRGRLAGIWKLDDAGMAGPLRSAAGRSWNLLSGAGGENALVKRSQLRSLALRGSQPAVLYFAGVHLSDMVTLWRVRLLPAGPRQLLPRPPRLGVTGTLAPLAP